MNVGTTLEANTKTTKVVEPQVSSFDDPPELPQSTTVLTAALGDYRLDTALAQFLTVGIGIVAAIGIENLGCSKGETAHTANRGIASTSASNCVTSWAFAAVRMALTGTPLASTRMWCLESGRARSVGFGPVFRPPQLLALTRNRRQHARSRACPPRVVSPAAACADGSIRRLPASRVAVEPQYTVLFLSKLSLILVYVMRDGETHERPS
ncbi:transposase (plasmid) [Paraburkholderia caribensis MBA4]|uniref:Transposase n=1 Tax=Paraburkholderia caribensis MBA4 TaxID=1323664 RepID=A0A0P0RQX9_9BURK|nr:transposase [Paraburkholderia caribensis MBA4]